MLSVGKTASVVVMYLLVSGLAGGDPDVTIDVEICTLKHYQHYGGYDNCIQYVIAEIIAMTAKQGYNYLVDGRSEDEFSGKCYAHTACNGNISPSDCSNCLEIALRDLNDYCSTSIGGKMKLKDCRIRYEDYSFEPDY